MKGRSRTSFSVHLIIVMRWLPSANQHEGYTTHSVLRHVVAAAQLLICKVDHVDDSCFLACTVSCSVVVTYILSPVCPVLRDSLLALCRCRYRHLSGAIPGWTVRYVYFHYSPFSPAYSVMAMVTVAAAFTVNFSPFLFRFYCVILPISVVKIILEHHGELNINVNVAFM